MGNAESSQESRKDKESGRASGSAPPSPPLSLQRKGSSFLEEPVIRKRTERGEVEVTLGREEDDGGREGHADDDGSGGRLRYAVSEMQGWRSHMEDEHALNPKLSSNRQQKQLLKDHHLFAVFDGHGGDYASHFCGENVVSTLTSQKDWQKYLALSSKGSSRKRSAQQSVTGLQLLKSALTATFLALDASLLAAQRERRLSQLSQLEVLVRSLGGGGVDQYDVFKPGTGDHDRVVNFSKQPIANMPASVPFERSGSTGVVVLVTPSHILCANAGDSRAMLSRRTSAAAADVLPLSFDHKPNNDAEVCRVEGDGGFVRNGRVDGDLAVSRSFGDFGYKRCDRAGGASDGDGKTPRDDKVTVHPDILVHNRDPDRDDFVVLACDGIWDRLTNQDCADLVSSLVHDEGETDVGLVCEEVIDTALELDSRDNMTCCVVLFPAAAACPPGDGPIGGGGVTKRRADRETSWGDGSTPAKRAQRRLDERRRKHRELVALQRSKAPRAQARGQAPHGKKHVATNPPAPRNVRRTRSGKSVRMQVPSSDDISRQ